MRLALNSEMQSKKNLYIVWVLGTVLLLSVFYGALSWLWSAAEESSAAALEKQVVSALSRDLAEGNLFKLGDTLAKLQRDGSLNYAEIRGFSQDGTTLPVFKTHGSMQSDSAFSGFKCGQRGKVISKSHGSVSLITTLPSNISGISCAALFLDSAFPDELKQLKRGILWSFGGTLALLFAIFFLVIIRTQRQISNLETEKKLLAVEKEAAVGRMAAQVAHDIRSPVFALEAALKNANQLPEKQRVIVRHAVNRIRDVANGLLEKNRQQQGSPAAGTTNTAAEAQETFLLSGLIEPVITEKRLQYESKPGIQINFDLSRESYGLFAKVQAVEFRRMISNLVNNAVEALGENGKVHVRFTQKDSRILLGITDDGKGIPPEVLTKLGQRGETYGKAGGSGLGLYHARTTAKSWGGTFSIASELGKGTTVSIELPKAEAPVYFAGEVKLAPGRPVVVLDDDPGIHELWRGRFESARLKDHNVEIFSFSEPATLRAWVKDNPDKASKAICLFDYELTGHSETGLTLAEELGLCGRTILATSRAEEKRIIDACAAHKVRIIPKGLADIVPIAIGGGPSPTQAVLLDDSVITQMTWETAAEVAGAKLLGYTEPEKFLADLGNFPKDMPIYIDSELGENVKGENIAAELKEKGFTNICLATAHPPERFAHLPWLKVKSKEAPWGQDDGAV